ncbi:MAG: crossover junction endodeoxyribonuclease RuvC, partial [Candidatus Paceibacteria bacterium]
TATTGFGIIEEEQKRSYRVHDYGVISTPSDHSDSYRLYTIRKNTSELITYYKPDIVAVEKLYFFRNATTVITVAQARGVVLLAAEEQSVQIYEFTPLQIKQALTGYGKSPKQQMQQMVQHTLKLGSIPKPDDAADGLAVALCCAQSNLHLFQ